MRGWFAALVLVGLVWWALGDDSASNTDAGSCRLEGFWNGAPEDGDTIDHLELDPGRGEVAYGYNRVVYYHIPFEYQRRGARLRLRYRRPWKHKTIRFELTAGRYDFRWRDIDTGEWLERSYDCRLSLSDSASPDGAEPRTAQVYYGVAPDSGRR